MTSICKEHRREVFCAHTIHYQCDEHQKLLNWQRWAEESFVEGCTRKCRFRWLFDFLRRIYIHSSRPRETAAITMDNFSALQSPKSKASSSILVVYFSKARPPITIVVQTSHHSQVQYQLLSLSPTSGIRTLNLSNKINKKARRSFPFLQDRLQLGVYILYFNKTLVQVLIIIHR